MLAGLLGIFNVLTDDQLPLWPAWMALYIAIWLALLDAAMRVTAPWGLLR